jgi:hypothetical protein
MPRFKEKEEDNIDNSVFKDLDITSPFLFPKEYDAIQP